MIGNTKRNKYPRYTSPRNVVPDWMGYPGSDYSRYDPNHEEHWYGERGVHALEGSGRQGWDDDQNRGYASVYGNLTGRYRSQEGTTVRNHTGKGPRNYRRSDERILEDVVDRVSKDPSIDLSEIEITVRNGEVFLSGRCSDRAVRHRIEDIAESVTGVRNVENAIRRDGK